MGAIDVWTSENNFWFRINLYFLKHSCSGSWNSLSWLKALFSASDSNLVSLLMFIYLLRIRIALEYYALVVGVFLEYLSTKFFGGASRIVRTIINWIVFSISFCSYISWSKNITQQPISTFSTFSSCRARFQAHELFFYEEFFILEFYLIKNDALGNSIFSVSWVSIAKALLLCLRNILSAFFCGFCFSVSKN